MATTPVRGGEESALEDYSARSEWAHGEHIGPSHDFRIYS